MHAFKKYKIRFSSLQGQAQFLELITETKLGAAM
jgi:hypothetical protein